VLRKYSPPAGAGRTRGAPTPAAARAGRLVGGRSRAAGAATAGSCSARKHPRRPGTPVQRPARGAQALRRLRMLPARTVLVAVLALLERPARSLLAPPTVAQSPMSASAPAACSAGSHRVVPAAYGLHSMRAISGAVRCKGGEALAPLRQVQHNCAMLCRSRLPQRCLHADCAPVYARC